MQGDIFCKWPTKFECLFCTLVNIAQNFGRVKLWQIDHFRVLARKMLANLTLATLVNLGKILANDVHFVKLAKVFLSQNFALYSNGHMSPSKHLYT